MKNKKIWKTVVAIGAAVLVGAVLRTCVTGSYLIPSPGMENSLYQGERILVNKWSYGLRLPLMAWWGYHRWGARPVQREDIILFNNPANLTQPVISHRETFIGRCTGTPGDTLLVDSLFAVVPSEMMAPDQKFLFSYPRTCEARIDSLLERLSIHSPLLGKDSLRSIRSFSSRPVARELLLELAQAGRLAPSASNLQAWHFFFLTDPELVKKVDLFSPGLSGHPPVILAICSDMGYAKLHGSPNSERYGCIMDAAMAAENIMLKALDERKEYIDSSLDAASKAETKVKNLQAEMDSIRADAERQKGEILRSAAETREKLLSEARRKAEEEGERIIAAAKANAEIEREAILRDARHQVALLSIAISEKLLRGKLDDEQSQTSLAEKLLNEMDKDMKHKEA